MENSSAEEQDRMISSSTVGGRPVGPDFVVGQPDAPKNEMIFSAVSPEDAAAATDQPDISDAGAGDLGAVYSHNVSSSHELNVYYEGYDISTGGYPQYINVEGLQVLPPVMYNENSSLMYHTSYGYNHEMAYGQPYSPVPTPFPSLLVNGQLYPAQQVQFSPSYYPQSVTPNMQHISPTGSISHTQTPQSGGLEGFSDSMLYSPESGYYVPFGTFGGGDLSGNSGLYNLHRDFTVGKNSMNGLNSADGTLSPVTSPAAYPQQFGILGPYEHAVGQMAMHGCGLLSSSSVGCYPHGGSYQSSNFGSSSVARLGGTDKYRFSHDQGKRRERDHDSIYVSNNSYDLSNDRNRGPRASKVKGKSSAEDGTLAGTSKNDSSTSLGLYNLADFVTDYEKAKFYVIKSFSEDNVHKSIKYNVWASTPLGNRKLDASYHEAKGTNGNCPVFLLFSVNASAQFCGVAEMVGPVDFEKDAGYWQQDRWIGQFPVQWHIIKDVPNSRFHHILLENNENKPVTHSRDTQEVMLEQGVEMLKVFKNHETQTSILDDFDFYNDRERILQERKEKQKSNQKTVGVDSLSGISATDAPTLCTNESSPSIAKNVQNSSLDKQNLNQVVDKFAETLKFWESG